MTLNRYVIFAAMLFTLPALAQHPVHGHKHKHHDEAADDQGGNNNDQGKRFGAGERTVIDDYFRAHPEARNELPPGLAKKGKVPPGWRKKFERGDRVPDDVWTYRQPLPRDIVVKLPVPPVGVVYVRINDRVAKVVEKTHEILDVLGLPEPRVGPPR